MFSDRLSRLSLYVVIGAAAILVVVHGLSPDSFRVDYVTVLLLVIILFAPFAPLVRRIKLGEFEAEIDKAEVDALVQQAKPAQEETVELTSKKISRKEEEHLIELAESEPASALADLGTNIEWKLHALLELSHLPERKKEAGRGLTLRQLSQYLNKNGLIDNRLKGALASFASIRNRTAHGSRIAASDAARVVESGLLILRELDVLAYQLLTPRDVRKISPEEERESRSALYKIATIVPYVRQPEKRFYVMNLDQLDAFLEGYGEYAEYVVSIERLEEKST